MFETLFPWVGQVTLMGFYKLKLSWGRVQQWLCILKYFFHQIFPAAQKVNSYFSSFSLFIIHEMKWKSLSFTRFSDTYLKGTLFIPFTPTSQFHSSPIIHYQALSPCLPHPPKNKTQNKGKNKGNKVLKFIDTNAYANRSHNNITDFFAIICFILLTAAKVLIS